MSIVSHLYHGELGGWCETRLTGSAEAAQHMAAQVRDREITRPEGPVDRHHWSQAGRAFALRLAALIQPAPPSSALLGLARAGLVSRSWADAQAARYPTHARLPEHRRERALDMRPMPGGWVDLQAARDAGATVGMAFTSTEQGHRRFSRPGLPDEVEHDHLLTSYLGASRSPHELVTASCPASAASSHRGAHRAYVSFSAAAAASMKGLISRR